VSDTPMSFFCEEFPGVDFVEGPVAALDHNGNAYKTYCIGGVKEQGECMVSLNYGDFDLAKRFFVETFRRALGDNKCVVVRRWPHFTEFERLEFDKLEEMIRRVPCVSVTGRFSFYKDANAAQIGKIPQGD
jgi:hypothetical protein